MADNDKNPKDTETILMALDQISQTIDVMTSVVGRLRTYLQENGDAQASTETSQNLHLETSPNRVLH